MFKATVFLLDAFGKRALRNEFGSERKAIRWVRRKMAKPDPDCLKKTGEVRRDDKLIWSGQTQQVDGTEFLVNREDGYYAEDVLQSG